MDLVVVAAVAFLTSILSAVAGLGGGIILLVVLAQFHPPIVAIPIQGGIQLFANSSRAVLLRDNIAWPVVFKTSILLVPASLLGAAMATSIPESVARLLLGSFVLIVAVRPQLLKWRGSETLPTGAIVGVGAVSGFLTSSIGASGPVTSPFLRAATVTHAAYVATAASSQILAHSAKLFAYGREGFDFAEHADTIAVGVVAVMVGTWVGTLLLGRGDEKRLAQIFRFVLTVLALRLISSAVLDLV